MMMIPSMRLVNAHGGSWQHRVLSPSRRIQYPEQHPQARYLTSTTTKLRSTSDSHYASEESRYLRQFEKLNQRDKEYRLLDEKEKVSRVENGNENIVMLAVSSTNSTRNSISYKSSTINTGDNSVESKIKATSQVLSKNVSTIVDNDEVDELLVLNHTDADSKNKSSSYTKDQLDEKNYDQNEGYINFPDGNMEDDDDDLYQPIRISAVLNEENGKLLTSSQRKFLLDDVLSPVLTAWSSALSVVPIDGNLIVDKSQLYDGRSCGPGVGSGFPSPIVPQEHLSDGVQNTDLVVYISISFFEGVFSPTETEFVNQEDHYDPNEHEFTDDFIIGDKDLGNPFIEQNTNETDSKRDSHISNSSVWHQRTQCDVNSTIISIHGAHYMQNESTLILCEDHINNTYLEVLNCNQSIVLGNNTITPNETETLLVPCGINNRTRSSNTTLTKCYEIFYMSNETKFQLEFLEFSSLSCDATTPSSSLWIANPIKSTSNISVNETESFNVTSDEGKPQNLIINKTGTANNIEEAESINIHESIPLCPSTALASATYCSTDQFDRPVAGSLNFCIDDSFFSEENLQRNILTAIHELAHILGLNSQSLAHFRNQDGSPITPRDDFGDVIEQDVECTGVNKGKMTIPLPSPDILEFREVRDIRVADIVTPTVRQVTRNQFDCQSLPGAELENGDVNENICIGDHWGRRVFRTDILNPVLDDVAYSMKISPLTLAYFKDSGWYKIDVSRSSLGSGWGRGAGCSFVDDKCVEADGQINASNEHFFCNARKGRGGIFDEIHGCSSDFSKKAICSLVDYEEMEQTIPKEYQYFWENYGPLWGGADPDLDFCPGAPFTDFISDSISQNNNMIPEA